ncbi:MAG: type II secretion system GspH family protein [Pseudomonadaceae bacterium]|nr:type II secretion system GspH family protein [Pseudomonadaceae bacterium]
MANVFLRLCPRRGAPPSRRLRLGGFAYVEVLIAAALIAVILPAAIQSGLLTGAVVEEESNASARHEARVARVEMIRGMAYRELLLAAETAGNETVPSSFSDPDGTNARIVVNLARYDGDGDPFVVADPNFDGDNNAFTDYRGLLWVRVTTEGARGELVTLVRPNHLLPSAGN